MMAQIECIFLALAMIVADYFIVRCLTSPNSSLEQKSSHLKDRISLIVGSLTTLFRGLTGAVILYHALLTVLLQYAPSQLSQVCPRHQNTNPALFTWNPLSTTALLLISLGTYVRLSAYNELGRYFTFHLATPGQLLTSGVYGWVQHPSYTGLVLIFTGMTALFLRFDATSACWTSDAELSQLLGWAPPVYAALLIITCLIVSARVRDEEQMLQKQFGGQWEEWHHSTKRFVPGLF